MQAGRPGRRSATLHALAAGPALLVLALILTLGVNVPFQDDWDTASILINWRRHALGITDFWQQHSEHRIVTVRLLIWLSGILTSFNVVAEMLMGFGFIAATLLIFRQLVRRCLAPHEMVIVPGVVAASSCVLFSLALQESWFFGTAAIELVLVPASVVVVWALTEWPDRRESLIAAIAAAVAGTFAEASGLALWPIGALAIVLTSESRRLLWIWIVSAASCAGLYLMGLHWSPSSPIEAIRTPMRLAAFVVSGLGLPFTYGAAVGWSMAAGAAGCVAVLASAIWIQRRRPSTYRGLRPLLLLAVHGLLISLVIGLGRSGLTRGSGTTSHYAVAAVLFCLGGLPVIAIALMTLVEDARSGTERRFWKVGAVAAACGLLGGYISSDVHGYRLAYERSRNLKMALASLYSTDPMPSDVSRFLYPPDDGRLQRQVDELKALRLGPFANRMDQQRRDLERSGRRVSRGSEGFHDGGDCDRTIGWAWDPAHPDATAVVDVWYQDRVIGTAKANWFRWDLLAAGKGNGQHGFIFVLPTGIESGTGRVLTVTFAGTDMPVGGSPRTVMCE